MIQNKAICSRCHETYDAHQIVRWQWGAQVQSERICPPPVGEVFKGGVLPDGYFLPLLDAICWEEPCHE